MTLRITAVAAVVTVLVASLIAVSFGIHAAGWAALASVFVLVLLVQSGAMLVVAIVALIAFVITKLST